MSSTFESHFSSEPASGVVGEEDVAEETRQDRARYLTTDDAVVEGRMVPWYLVDIP